jgi:hypothetical protein
MKTEWCTRNILMESGEGGIIVHVFRNWEVSNLLNLVKQNSVLEVSDINLK